MGSPSNWKKVIRKILLPESEEAQNSFPDDKVNESTSLQSTSCRNINANSSKVCSVLMSEDKSSKCPKRSPASKNLRTKQVPEWNTIFKSILNPKPSVQEKQKYTPPTPEPSISQEIERSRRIMKSSCSARAVQISAEEKEAREYFARSTLFKRIDHYQYNLNDFDGAGIDIFKYSDNKARLTPATKTTVKLKI